MFTIACDEVVLERSVRTIEATVGSKPSTSLCCSNITCRFLRRSLFKGTLAVYPSFESAAGNLEARQKWHESLKSTLKETFYYEGEVTFIHNKNAN